MLGKDGHMTFRGQLNSRWGLRWPTCPSCSHVVGLITGLEARSASTAVPKLWQHQVHLQPARQNHTVHVLMQLSSNRLWQAHAGHEQVLLQGDTWQ